MSRLLATGGAGYIGSHAMRALARAGHEVVAYDDLSEGHADAVLDRPLVVGDILDTDRLEVALKEHQTQAVLHFAARAYVGESVQKPDLYWRINRDGTRSVLEAMGRAGVAVLVFSSSCAVCGIPETVPMGEELPQRPINPYGETKAAMEREIQAVPGLRHGIFRYFNAAGASEDGVLAERHDPEPHLIPRVLKAARDGGEVSVYGDDYPTPDGTCIRDYVHVCDLADAHALAVEHLLQGGESFLCNLGYGQGHSVYEVIESARRVTGRELDVRVGPRRPGDPPALYAIADRVRALLGWQPSRTELDTIVGHAWAAMPD